MYFAVLAKKGQYSLLYSRKLKMPFHIKKKSNNVSYCGNSSGIQTKLFFPQKF
jgi:hypothetical protein